MDRVSQQIDNQVRSRVEVGLECEVAEGLFPDELSVRIELGGDSVVAFVPANSVVIRGGSVGPDQTARGMMKVGVIREIAGKLLIGLPSDTLSTGSRLLINKNLIKSLT